MHPRPWLAPRRSALLVLAALAVTPPLALAQPMPGFVETWPGTSLQGWGGGASYSNPGTGGVGGAGDGFLIASRPLIGNLGTMSPGEAYVGDWRAAGIASVRVWLKDIGANEALEIHFAIGNALSFWQYNVGFQPPDADWQEFVIDLTSDAGWTRIIGSGTFDNALRDVDRVLLRHDAIPYVQAPNAIRADFGIDNFTLSDASTSARGTTWGRLKALYR